MALLVSTHILLTRAMISVHVWPIYGKSMYIVEIDYNHNLEKFHSPVAADSFLQLHEIGVKSAKRSSNPHAPRSPFFWPTKSQSRMVQSTERLFIRGFSVFIYTNQKSKSTTNNIQYVFSCCPLHEGQQTRPPLYSTHYASLSHY